VDVVLAFFESSGIRGRTPNGKPAPLPSLESSESPVGEAPSSPESLPITGHKRVRRRRKRSLENI